MKKTILVVLLLLLVSSAFAGSKKTFSSGTAADARASVSDPRMSAEERAKAVKLLIDSQQAFFDAIDKLSNAQWNYRQSPFKWSVGLTAEHIVLAEERIFRLVQFSVTQKPNPDWEAKTAGKEQVLERILPSRTGRAAAPIEIQPKGKLTRAELIAKFKENRAKIMEFAEKTDLPLKAHTVDNPFPVFSTLNAYDWLLYIPFHTQRHLKQIAEVKAVSGYPK